MGQVWRAYDGQLNRPVALKMVSGGRGVDTLRKEVHGCLELTHPNIIRIYDLVVLPGEDPFISMEYIEGEDLTQKAKQKEGERFSWQEIEPYILSLCEGLAYAHDQGMVHRDIKPQNLMITKENELKLADFGIAAPLQDEDGESDIQVPRAGTPIYWSPQQAQGMNPAPTDDIYALGVTLFQLLVGEAPFKGANEPALTYQHINEEPPHPLTKLKELGGEGKISGYVSDLILKCLANKLTERFKGAAEVQAWIKAKGDPVVKRQKRMALVSAALGIVALVMGAVAIWAWNQRTEAEVQRGIAQTKQQQAEKAKKEEAKQREIAQAKQMEAETAKEAEAKQRKEAEAAKEAETKQRETAEKRLRNLVEIRVALAKGAALLRETKKPETEGAVQNLLGEISLALKLPNEALEHNEKALDLAMEKLPKDHPLVLAGYNNIGLAHLEKNEYDKALVYFQKPLSILPNIRLRPKYSPRSTELRTRLRTPWSYTGKLTPAEVKLDFCEATSYAGLGEVHRGKGEYDQALEYHQKALVIYLELVGPNDLKVGTCYNNIGLVCKAKGEHAKALAYYQKAQQLYSRNRSIAAAAAANLSPLWRPSKHGLLLEAISYNNIGLMHSAKGEYDKAILNFQNAATMSSTGLGQNHPHVALIYLNTAFAYKAIMDHSSARQCYHVALLILMKKLGPTSQSMKNIRAELDKLPQEMKATPKPPAPPKK